MVLKLLKPNDPRLKQECEPLTDEELDSLDMNSGIVGDLIETMLHHNAAGIAGPQVGIMKRIFVILSENAKQALVFANPEIVKISDKNIEMTEGCLSFPNIWVKIVRSKFGKIRSYDFSSKQWKTLKFTGNEWREILHEVDHLDGKVITDYK